MWVDMLFVAAGVIVSTALAAAIGRSGPSLKRLRRRDPEAAEKLAQELANRQRYGGRANYAEGFRGVQRRR